jgi:hypothetical protein
MLRSMSSRDRSFIARAVAPAWAAARARLPVIGFIQACGVALVVAFYASARLRETLGVVSDAKARGGLLFTLVTSVVFGALVPEAARFLLGDRRWPIARWRDLGHAALMFAVNGVVLDRFYALLAHRVGEGHDAGVVAQKILLDAFVFTPFVSIPIFLVLVLLREASWNPVRLARGIGWRLVPDRVVPVLVPCWIYWIPLQACIYSLPLHLQFPFALTCISAWSLVLVFVARRLDLIEPGAPPSAKV